MFIELCEESYGGEDIHLGSLHIEKQDLLSENTTHRWGRCELASKTSSHELFIEHVIYRGPKSIDSLQQIRGEDEIVIESATHGDPLGAIQEDGDSESKSLGEESLKDCSGDMRDQRLATLISNLRYQIVILDERLATIDDNSSPQFKELSKSRKDKQSQVDHLLEQLHNPSTTSFNSESTPFIGITSISRICVRPVIDNSSTMLSVVVGTDAEFTIEAFVSTELEQATPPLSTTKRYSEVYKLRKQVSSKYAKVKHLPFPDPHSDGLKLANEIEGFLSLLVNDDVVRNDPLISDFFTGIIGGNLKLAKSESGLVSRAMKSASSLLGNDEEAEILQGRTRVYEHAKAHTDSLVVAPPEREPQSGSDAKSASKQLYSIKPLDDANLEMLIEALFDLLGLVFELHEPTQWIRRKIMQGFKGILKQYYGDALGKGIADALNRNLTEEKVLEAILKLESILWNKDGVFIRDIPPPVRSVDQQFATMLEARTLMVNTISDSVVNLMGKYNCLYGMARLFNILQTRELNRVLLINLLDTSIRQLFADRV